MSIHAHANWLIDEARRHVSAHGRMECLECHGGIAQAGRHPNADRVDRGPGEAFSPGRCTGCHGAALDDLGHGRHGGQPVVAAMDYDRCVACHNPHEQLKAADAGRFDPAQPPQAQCGNCHEPRSRLPEPSRDDDTCLACHSRYALDTPAGVRAARTLCLACHGRDDDRLRAGAVGRVPMVDLEPDGLKPHQGVACLTCHPGSAQYGHSRQATGDCRRCHVRHGEGVAHDAHLSVTCEACHLKQVVPRKEKESGLIGWVRQAGNAGRLHDMRLTDDEASCRRCHHRANLLGAAAMVLPAKSILCLPCHAATFSAGDTITMAALIVFVIGLAGSVSYWFSGAVPSAAPAGLFDKAIWIAREIIRAVFSAKVFYIAKNLILEGLLQLKFYRLSPSRWLVHGLMVWPFAFRFLWGIVALLASLWAPGRDWPWAMLDKNHPVHGMFFDATGLMIVIGAALATLRSASSPSSKLPAMPRHDRLMPGLLGAIVVGGFVLEGVRIAMTGYPPGSAYAFVGDALSRFFFGVAGLEEIYGYVWYIHALLTGAFVACLPFSRMFHIVLAPVLLAVNATGRHK